MPWEPLREVKGAAVPEIVSPSVTLTGWTHGTVTFYLTGVSRSFTHELIRHRHFSYSQLSQRYVPERDAAMVEPDVIAADPELHKRFLEATEAGVRAYNELLAGLRRKLAGVQRVAPNVFGDLTISTLDDGTEGHGQPVHERELG